MATPTPTPDQPVFEDHEGTLKVFVDDSGKAAGHEVYKDHVGTDGTKQRVFLSTVVDDDYQGQGVAGKLVEYSLNRAIDEGFRIVAVCPYVKRWIEKQDDERYRDASDTARPEHFTQD